jgi:hypothetical protein
MSTDNTSKPADQPTSVSTAAEQVKKPVGSKAWDTPPQGQDASPTPDQGMPDTPATAVEVELAERTGTLTNQVEYAEYLANDTVATDFLPPGTGPAITVARIGHDLWNKRDVIVADAKEALGKGKAAIDAVGRATGEAMGEMVHQVYGDPPTPERPEPQAKAEHSRLDPPQDAPKWTNTYHGDRRPPATVIEGRRRN